MDTECAKMKEECDLRVKEITASKSAEQYSIANSEEQEDRIGLILEVGTIRLKCQAMQSRYSKLETQFEETATELEGARIDC